MVYGGLGLAAKIARDLDALLTAEGLTAEAAIGTDRDRWL